MCLRIVRVGIVNIVRAHQFNAGLRAQTDKALIDRLLFRNAMVLQFQVEMILSEYLLIFPRCLQGRLIAAGAQLLRDLSGETGAGAPCRHGAYSKSPP